MATLISRNRETGSHNVLAADKSVSFIRLSDDGHRATIRIEGSGSRNYYLYVPIKELNRVIEDYQRACNATTKG